MTTPELVALAKERCAELMYEAIRYKMLHADFSAERATYQGQLDTANELLMLLCEQGKGERTRIMAPHEEALKRWRKERGLQ